MINYISRLDIMDLNIEIKLIDYDDVKKVDYYIITIDRHGKSLIGTFYDITRICYYYEWMEKIHRYLPGCINRIRGQHIHVLEFLEKNNCNFSLEKTNYHFGGFYFDNEVIPSIYRYVSNYMTKLQQEFAEYYLSKGYDRISIWCNGFEFYDSRYYFGGIFINYVTKTMILGTIPQVLRKLIGDRKIRNHDGCECLYNKEYKFKIVEEDNRIIIYDYSCDFYKEAFIV